MWFGWGWGGLVVEIIIYIAFISFSCQRVRASLERPLLHRLSVSFSKKLSFGVARGAQTVSSSVSGKASGMPV